MRFLMRLLSVVILFGWGGYSYAYEVEIDWRPSSDGRTMYFTVLSVNSRLTDITKVNCGLFASCYVRMEGGSLGAGATYSYDFPKMSGFRGTHTVKKIADTWGASSPSGHIGNWGEMVDKIGGNPCFQFSIYGGHFGSTCGGTATPPPPPPKPPEPQVSCYISGNIYLQHGSLADSNVSGNRADASARIYCTKAAKVKVSAVSSIGSSSYMVNLRSDGSLKSILTVNGVAGNVSLDVPGAAGRDVVFSSTLLASGTPAPGDFSGSAVAVVDIL